MTTAAPTAGRPGRRAARKPATMAQALSRALRDAMAEDPAVHVLGEDVGTLGGVFRITDGLAKEFGEDRCTDTPLAEAGILGTAVGMAMYGLRPVVEMQFDAFAYPAFEQLDQPCRARCATAPAGAHAAADHHPRPLRRRHRRRRAPQRLLRGVLHGAPPACTSSPPRRSRTPTGCCGPPSPPTTRWSSWSPSGCTGRRPTGRPDAPAEVAPIGRAVVRRPGRTRHADHLRPVAAGLPGGGRGGARRRAGTWKSSTCAPWCPSTTRRSRASVRAHRAGGRRPRVHRLRRRRAAEIAARVTERCFHHLEAPVLRVAGFDIPYPPPMLERHHLPGVDRILDAVGRLQWEAAS